MASPTFRRFDNRSFRLNDEANLNVIDPDFGRKQAAVFEADWTKGQRITHAQWLAWPWSNKLQERLASLLHSQL